ncbi:oxidoreductase [Aureliella helgolandensis]|uniref:NADPH dehydrogenase n=1 Tax=Aureliella helgolandensis TaxID=2527968 RepID=A0A518GG66_9BACT|nr:NADH:flavin oxidoreductase [Aureliella helgolandensis]QDV27589.1 NADPH dehydrogenase [Aureliella helgolandensis]
MASPKYPKIAQLRTVEKLQQHLSQLQISLPCDPDLLSASEESPLGQSIKIGSYTAGNRWCIHPMEGWDANRDGSPTHLTIRRWERFGQSGAKLIWGGEAAAVQPRGRANPNQTLAMTENESGLRTLLESLVNAHRAQGDSTDDLVVGLQLTHSGRFCKPNDHKKWESRIAYHHPLLDPKFGIDPQDDSMVLSDDDLEQLIDDYVAAARLAQRIGFQFVDVKACHGYLLHELLSARIRPGRFGGDLAGRSLVLRTAIERIRHECPGLAIGVRLSLFDALPYQPGEEVGVPMPWKKGESYEFGFGVNPNDPSQIDLSEPKQLVQLLIDAGVDTVNYTCGSPYYNPHIQRPAIFPPSDGYRPPEDPLVGVARQIHATAEMKAAFPSLPVVGSGYTYLQEFLPLVGQAVVRDNWVDIVGLGRMVLSHPTLPRDTLAGQAPSRKLICRTFSDCTTAPRNGIVSGCYPLDELYKGMPEREKLLQFKQDQ